MESSVAAARRCAAPPTSRPASAKALIAPDALLALVPFLYGGH